MPEGQHPSGMKIAIPQNAKDNPFHTSLYK